MSRCRKISSDISTDAKLNRVSELAALLYSWGIPHARDDCRLPKRNPEELRLLIIPGRLERSAADVSAALGELMAEELIGVDKDGYYFFPGEVFYKIQTYIGHKNRRETPKLNKITPAEISGKQRRSAEIAENQRECAENSASPSPSHSPSLRSRTPAADPVDKSGSEDDRSKVQPAANTPQALVALAIKIGAGDPIEVRPHSQQKLAAWTMSQWNYLKDREPQERVAAVIQSTLTAFEARMKKDGEPVGQAWPYLNAIFDRERVKYIQGPEHEANKKPITMPPELAALVRGIGDGGKRDA